jgi:hypothetical protein
MLFTRSVLCGIWSRQLSWVISLVMGGFLLSLVVSPQSLLLGHRRCCCFGAVGSPPSPPLLSAFEGPSSLPPGLFLFLFICIFIMCRAVGWFRSRVVSLSAVQDLFWFCFLWCGCATWIVMADRRGDGSFVWMPRRWIWGCKFGVGLRWWWCFSLKIGFF